MGSLDKGYPLADNALLYARWAAPAPHSYSFSLADLAAFTADVHTSTRDSRPSQEQKDVSSRFGRRLRGLRQERNLTQSNMAKKFGIDRSFISDVERGRKSISLPLIEVIAIGMGVTLSDLFDGV